MRDSERRCPLAPLASVDHSQRAGDLARGDKSRCNVRAQLLRQVAAHEQPHVEVRLEAAGDRAELLELLLIALLRPMYGRHPGVSRLALFPDRLQALAE